MADPIKAFFWAALDTPADRRPAYLDGVCGGDAEVRRRVEALLRAHEGPDWLLDRPAWCPAPQQEVAGPAPAADQTERAGRIHLQGEIARGGMGVVLRGHDPELGRELAVKVILPAHRDTPSSVRRFVGEARLAGQLQHPGIVPVYDVGQLADGRPFFAMKLIRGRTLAELLAERPDPGHDLPRFLRYFEAVCQAVGYAHASGVIHRDLKPLNVMVGAFGEVQVMDWGLAKVLAEASGGLMPPIEGIRQEAHAPPAAGATQPGQVMGTLAYMAPEQASAEAERLDRRGDVFGLGAILCEILTGQPPYVNKDQGQLHRQAAGADLGDARVRLDGCGADAELVGLALACLAPNREDRPPDAQAVADALTAFLEGVQARLRRAELAEAEARTRAAEEAKRLRLTLALAGTVLLALALGGGGALWLQADRQARQSRLARDVNEALNRVTALREQAKAASDGAALLAQAREQAQRALALVESGPADKALVTQVRRAQEELDEEEKDRRFIAALDSARLAQAETVAGQNRFATEQAVPLMRAAFRAYGLPAGEGEPAAAAARLRQRPPQVREAASAALDEWIDLAADPLFLIKEPHLDWLRALAAAEPHRGGTQEIRAACQEKDPDKRRAALEKLAAAADVRQLPAHTLTRLARRLGAAQSPGCAVQLLRRARQEFPADFWVNQELGLALEQEESPQWAEAVRYLTAAVTARPKSPGAHLNLGLALKASGQLDEAVASCRQAIALDEKYAGAHCGLGIALLAMGRLDEAIASCRTAIALAPKFVGAHASLGAALQARGRLDEAADCYRQAIVLDPKYVKGYTTLGLLLSSLARPDEAVACLRRAVDLNPKDSRAHYNLGNTLQDCNQIDEAIASYRRALALDPKYAPAHHNLGDALKARGRLDEAIACLRRAVELDPKRAMFHLNLGVALQDKGQESEAIACFRRVIELDPKDARAHYNIGRALQLRGKLDEAAACYQRAIALDPQFAPAHTNLGNVFRARRQFDEAIACYRRAIDADPKYAPAHLSLSLGLLGTGRYAEARDASVRALELLPDEHPTRQAIALHTQACQRLVKLEQRLPRLLQGEVRPASAREGVDLAAMCRLKRLHADAARFFAFAFVADSRLADDLNAGHRYHAACSAALAAAGQSEGAAKLDDTERMRLRKQALDWLRADLASRTRQLDGDRYADRAAAGQALRSWQANADLAGIRDKAALADLPAEERQAFAQLWADVAATLQKAEEQAK